MSSKRALITGMNGFCGRHLGAHLARQDYAVFGVDLAPGRSSPSFTFYAGDIRDARFVEKVIIEIRPTQIFHLAALVSSRADPNLLHDVNVRGTENLMAAVFQADLDPVILVTGSSAAYGLVEAVDIPIRESQPFRPLDAYAVSKIAQEMLAYTYYARHGLKVIRTRAFNIVGPGEPPSLVCSAFAKQLAEIEARRVEPVLHVGNLTTQRDFVDVRDVVRAYRLLAQRGRPGEVYNVCSGKAVTVQTCLDELLRLTTRLVKVEQDPARMRPSDIPISVGDGQLVRKHAGWHPDIPLGQSLADLLDDWRRRIQET
jgi:GDP-4-dehydro-6-deoxy-D-mannose reductase